MRLHPTWPVAVAVLTLFAAAGCGGSNDKQGSTSTSSATTTQRPARRAPAKKGPVPQSLGSVESGAEDTIDFAHAGDRARVVKTTQKLRKTARARAAADLREAGVPAALIAELQSRVRLLAGIAGRAELARVSLAANRISALMPTLYARFRDPVPPAVLELDYLDREAQLRSIAGDQSAVPPATKALVSTWAPLRARVIRAGGRKVAGRYTRHVIAMRRLARGADREALQDEAARGLELVDELERQFTR